MTRLATLWNWLPAFRAVAETEHLPSAARAMRLSASALSRSVSQLEAALDQQLFIRTKRRMHLNPAGLRLLTAVRDAMRRIDDGLSTLTVTHRAGVRVAGDGAWIGLLLAPGDAPGIELEHVELDQSAMRDGLMRGLVDLAVTETVTPSDDILIERLGTVARAVCKARAHAPTGFALCTTGSDPWPAELPRNVVLRSPRLDPVIEACRTGVARGVLPTAIARTRGLQVLPSPRVAASQLYLLRRIPLGTSPVETLLPALRQRAQRLFRASA